MVVLDADASAPLLDFALGGPKTDIYWVGSVENQSGGGNVDTVHKMIKMLDGVRRRYSLQPITTVGIFPGELQTD